MQDKMLIFIVIILAWKLLISAGKHLISQEQNDLEARYIRDRFHNCGFYESQGFKTYFKYEVFVFDDWRGQDFSADNLDLIDFDRAKYPPTRRHRYSSFVCQLIAAKMRS